jgi:hypothetical protein
MGKYINLLMQATLVLGIGSCAKTVIPTTYDPLELPSSEERFRITYTSKEVYGKVFNVPSIEDALTEIQKVEVANLETAFRSCGKLSGPKRSIRVYNNRLEAWHELCDSWTKVKEERPAVPGSHKSYTRERLDCSVYENRLRFAINYSDIFHASLVVPFEDVAWDVTLDRVDGDGVVFNCENEEDSYALLHALLRVRDVVAEKQKPLAESSKKRLAELNLNVSAILRLNTALEYVLKEERKNNQFSPVDVE